ncbi:hypothetical protein CRUP_010073, partial [Coryphaenoides rupestris]
MNTDCVLSSAASALSSPERRSERRSEKASHTTMASMTVKRPPHQTTDKTQLGYLQWEMKHSTLRNMSYYHASWVRVHQPGDYYVYARVSFSGGGGGAAQPARPLVSVIRVRHDQHHETSENAMKAYCTLGNHNAGLCTTSQGQLLQLQAGNLLGVWVENT